MPGIEMVFKASFPTASAALQLLAVSKHSMLTVYNYTLLTSPNLMKGKQQHLAARKVL